MFGSFSPKLKRQVAICLWQMGREGWGRNGKDGTKDHTVLRKRGDGLVEKKKKKQTNQIVK